VIIHFTVNDSDNYSVDGYKWAIQLKPGRMLLHQSQLFLLLMPGVIYGGVFPEQETHSVSPINGEVQKLGLEWTVLWDFVYSTTDYVLIMIYAPMPIGNVLLIATNETAAQVTAAGCTFSGEVWLIKWLK